MNGAPAGPERCPICGTATAAAGATANGYALRVCAACGHRHAPEAMTPQVDYDEVWTSDGYAEKRALAACADPRALGRHPTYAPFFRRHGAGRGRTLLDVGCGSGRFCRAAAAWGYRVQGIDVAARAVAAARAQGFASARRASLDALAAAGERYEIVTAFEVLEHLADVGAFLASAWRTLAGGGHFFCTVPNGECAAVLASARADELPPVHRHFFSRRSLLAAAGAAGFAGARAGRIGTDPAPDVRGLARWLARRALRRPNPPLGLWLSADRGG